MSSQVVNRTYIFCICQIDCCMVVQYHFFSFITLVLLSQITWILFDERGRGLDKGWPWWMRVYTITHTYIHNHNPQLEKVPKRTRLFLCTCAIFDCCLALQGSSNNEELVYMYVCLFDCLSFSVVWSEGQKQNSDKRTRNQHTIGMEQAKGITNTRTLLTTIQAILHVSMVMGCVWSCRFSRKWNSKSSFCSFKIN